MADEIRAVAYDTRTGSILWSLPISSLSWSESLNEAGDWTVDVAMSREARAFDWRGALAPWKASIALIRGTSDVLQAGPLITRKWAPSSDTLTLSGKGFWALMTKRLAIDSLLVKNWTDGEVLIDDDHPADKWALTYQGTLRDIAYRFNVSSNDWDPLPITENTISSSTSNYRRYMATDLRTIAECLTDLANCDGGPELAFRPFLSGGKVQADFIGGTPELITNKWTWNTTLPGQRVYLDSLDEDGSDIANSVYMLGGRHDDVVLVARSENRKILDAGYPLLQVGDTSHTTVSELATLKSWTDGAADVLGGLQETYSLKVGVEYRVRAGDWADVLLSDGYLGTTTVPMKITKVAGDDSEWQTIQAVRR